MNEKNYMPMTAEQRTIAEENMMIVPYVMHKHGFFLTTGIEHDELIAIGNEALCNAAATFDKTRGFQFSTYAAKVIYNQVAKVLRRRVQQKRECDISVLSLEYMICEDSTLLDTLKSADNDLQECAAIRDAVCRALNKMSKKEKCVVAMHMSGYTQCEIANETGMSQPGAGRYIAKFRKLTQDELQCGAELNVLE